MSRGRRVVIALCVCIVMLVGALPRWAPVIAHATGSTPTVTALSPQSGPSAGGATVTITGTNFSATASADTVDFGSTAVQAVTAATTTSLTVTSPAGEAGEVYVTVTVGGLTSATGTASAYLYSDQGAYVPLAAQERVCDTRTGSGYACSDGGITGGATIRFQVGGEVGVPTNATAIYASLTTIGGTSASWVQMYADGLTRPSLANDILYQANETISNMVEVPLGQTGYGSPAPTGEQGWIDVYNGGTSTVQVILDVEGYVTAATGQQYAGLMNSVEGIRICDTRTGESDGVNSACTGTGTVGANSGITFQVTGMGSGTDNIPSVTDVEAAVVTITAIPASGSGIVTAGSSCGCTSTSDLDYTYGQNNYTPMVDQVVVPVNSSGDITVYNDGSGTTNLVIDAEGWVSSSTQTTSPAGSDLMPLAATRACDTRYGSGFGCAVAASGDYALPGGSSPSNSDSDAITLANVAGLPPVSQIGAVAVNITIIPASSGGFAAAWPDGDTPPTTSLNQFGTDEVTETFDGIIGLGSDGAIRVFSQSQANVVIDVEGWFPRYGQAAPVDFSAMANNAYVGDPAASSPHGDAMMADAGPVNPESGELYENDDVVSIGELGGGPGLGFDLSYNSQEVDGGGPPLGAGWTADAFMGIAATATQGEILDGTGGDIDFTPGGSTGSPAATMPAYTASTLTGSIAAGWTLTRWNGEVFTFNASGLLTSAEQRGLSNTKITYSYTSGQLTSITDAVGRQLQLSYTGSYLTGITEPSDSSTGTMAVSFGYTGGLLTTYTNTSGYVTHYGYNSLNQLTTIEDPDSVTATIQYNADDQVCWIYVGTSSNSCSSPPSGATTYAYTGSGGTAPYDSTLVVTDPSGYSTQYTFEYDLMVQEVQGYGGSPTATTSYLYDPYSLGTEIETEPNGTVDSATYDADGNTLSSTVFNASDPPKTTTSTYDSLNDVLTVTSADGNVAGCGCASQYTTTNTYDGNGQELTSTDSGGNVTTNTYESGGGLCWVGLNVTGTSCSSPPTSVTAYYYDANNNLDKTISDDGGANQATATQTMNVQGWLENETSPDGNETSYTFFPSGDVNEQTAPSSSGTGSQITSYTYNDDGAVATETDPTGAVTTNYYSATTGRLCWTFVGGSISGTQMAELSCTAGPYTIGLTGSQTLDTYYVNGEGNLHTSSSPEGVTTASPNGVTTTYNYNDLNEVTSETSNSPSGGSLSYTYDADGQVLTETNANSGVTTYTYNADHSVATVEDPDHNLTTYHYDSDGNQLWVEDASGNYTVTPHNKLDQICWSGTTTSASVAAGATCSSPITGATVYAYDDAGNADEVTDGDGNVTTYQYNALGELCWSYPGTTSDLSASDPPTCPSGPSGDTAYTYDKDGNILTEALPDGDYVLNAYNANDQACWTVTATSDESGTCSSPPTGTSYDWNTYNSDGELASSNDIGLSKWTYNAIGQETSYENGEGETVQYGYDDAGNVNKLTYPDGRVVSYAYTASTGGTPEMCWTYVGTSSNSCSNAPSGAITYSYDGDGQASEEVYPNGASNGFTYDTADELTAVNDTGFSATYGRNPDGLVQSDTSQDGGLDDGYSYTDKNQVCALEAVITEGCSPTDDDASAFQYDNAGNLTYSSYEGGSGQYQGYRAQNELCWTSSSSGGSCVSPPSGATTYGFNAEGDRTSMTPTTGSATSYTFNDLNEMTSVNTGSTSVGNYGYDGNGLRVWKTTATTGTYFAWDDEASTPLLLSEYNYGAGTYTDYVYGPGGQAVEEILTGGSKYYYSVDDLGSIRALTNSSGTVVQSYSYTPYGVVSGGGSVQNNLLFEGQYLDSETGFYYMRARYYDPATGQFLSIDPDMQETDEPYQFTADDPVNNSDPTGDFYLTEGSTPVIDANAPSSETIPELSDPGSAASHISHQIEETTKLSRSKDTTRHENSKSSSSDQIEGGAALGALGVANADADGTCLGTSLIPIADGFTCAAAAVFGVAMLFEAIHISATMHPVAFPDTPAIPIFPAKPAYPKGPGGRNLYPPAPNPRTIVINLEEPQSVDGGGELGDGAPPPWRGNGGRFVIIAGGTLLLYEVIKGLDSGDPNSR